MYHLKRLVDGQTFILKNIHSVTDRVFIEFENALEYAKKLNTLNPKNPWSVAKINEQ
ncbi:hypothetical protein ABC345_05860 [Shouchella sp. 1P09AA]|uniref:hypothetical protein n=1 Tax=Bacillaceae TaxID=186817 RepID=UPI00159B9F48|nr:MULTISPECIES: hypothetical protein [Bacillaceae]UTR07557.1 hypothetical protein MM326_05880 [Alkalihalobacillus sp. LMS6]